MHSVFWFGNTVILTKGAYFFDATTPTLNEAEAIPNGRFCLIRPIVLGRLFTQIFHAK